MSGVTKLDRIRNERIIGMAKVGEISKKKVQESCLKWTCIEMRRRMCGQDGDGDRGAVEEKERKSESQVVG